MSLELGRLVNAPRQPTTIPKVAPRAAIALLGVAGWFASQSVLGSQGFPQGIGDRIHLCLAPATEWLAHHYQAADSLLIVTSAIIDLLGSFLLVSGIVSPSVRPLLGLIVLFILRQLCQVLIALPPPDGMIWRYPGVPSFFVTYSTANDFFFSGHTAIAVYSAIELARLRRRWLTSVGTAIAVIEALSVLMLRAHYYGRIRRDLRGGMGIRYRDSFSALMRTDAKPILGSGCRFEGKQWRRKKLLT
jgi:hypothetical protein